GGGARDDAARPFTQRLARARDSAALRALGGVGSRPRVRERIQDDAALRRVRIDERVRDALRERAAEAMQWSGERRGLAGSEGQDALSRRTHRFAILTAA